MLACTRSLAFALVATLLLDSTGAAQTLRPLARTGDVIPGLGTVSGVESVDLAGGDGWLVRVRTGAAWNPQRGHWRDGALTLREGQTMSAVPGATLLSIADSDIDHAGRELTTLTLAGVPNPQHDTGVYVDGAPMVVEGQSCGATSIPANTKYGAVQAVRANGQDEVLALMIIEDPTYPGEDLQGLFVLRHDGAGGLVYEEARWTTYQQFGPWGMLVQEIPPRPEAIAFNDAGQVLVVIDAFAPDDDTAIYLDHFPVIREGQASPVTGLAWGDLREAVVALGANGEIALRARLDTGDPANDEALFLDGVLLAREGDAPPGVSNGSITGFAQSAIEVSPDGRVLWFAEWDGPEAGAGWFLGDELLVRTGRAFADATITEIESDAASVDFDGASRRFAFLARLDDGSRAALLLDFDRGARVACASDLALCPCANVTAAADRAGCANSGGAGAVLFASGSLAVGADDLALRAEGVPAGQTGLFLASDQPAAQPFRDGILCAGAGFTWLEIGFADASGALGTTSPATLALPPTPGQDVVYQLWYRDPGLSPCGSGSNTSAALVVSWR